LLPGLSGTVLQKRRSRGTLWSARLRLFCVFLFLTDGQGRRPKEKAVPKTEAKKEKRVLHNVSILLSHLLKVNPP
jgi:hypothetical protein